jgi:hypothetical protein
MKKVIFSMLMGLLAIHVHAQKWSEWFRQAKTQKKYLLEQIAAYQTYLSYLNTGYNLVKDKNNLLGLLKGADLDQHRDKYERLKKASPAVRNNPKVQAILDLGEGIIPIAHKTIVQAAQAALLQPTEAAYIKKVFDRLLEQCQQVLEELSYLVTDGKVQLTDAQRLERINELYADMQVKYTFAYSFSREARILNLTRKRTTTEVNAQNDIHQIR